MNFSNSPLQGNKGAGTEGTTNLSDVTLTTTDVARRALGARMRIDVKDAHVEALTLEGRNIKVGREEITTLEITLTAK